MESKINSLHPQIDGDRDGNLEIAKTCCLSILLSWEVNLLLVCVKKITNYDRDKRNTEQLHCHGTWPTSSCRQDRFNMKFIGGFSDVWLPLKTWYSYSTWCSTYRYQLWLLRVTSMLRIPNLASLISMGEMWEKGFWRMRDNFCGTHTNYLHFRDWGWVQLETLWHCWRICHK
jgi:hypothetical protein